MFDILQLYLKKLYLRKMLCVEQKIFYE